MAAKNKTYDIKDSKLAEKGKKRVDWASKDMPVLALIADRFRKQPAEAVKMISEK